MPITKNTSDILGKLQDFGFGPEVGDKLERNVRQPLQGFIRQSLQKDFAKSQPQKNSAPETNIPVYKNPNGEDINNTILRAKLEQSGFKAAPKAPKAGFFGSKTVEPTETQKIETTKPGLTK